MLPASVPVGHNERGVTLVLVNQSEGGMASVPVRQMEEGVVQVIYASNSQQESKTIIASFVLQVSNNVCFTSDCVSDCTSRCAVYFLGKGNVIFSVTEHV